METRQQKLLRQALEHKAGKAPLSENGSVPCATPMLDRPEEASLRDLSLQRTQSDYVPRTLTPYEWELYYQEHGIPEAHRRPLPAAQVASQSVSGGSTRGGEESVGKGWLSALISRLFH